MPRSVVCNIKTKIKENETSGDLYERLTVLGADVLLKTLEAIKTNFKGIRITRIKSLAEAVEWLNEH